MSEQAIDIDEARDLARRYLAPPRDCFWQWSDRGQTLEWINGPTIAFAPELHKVLARLAIGGLPPLSAVIALLAACRENGLQSASSLTCTAGAHPLLEDVIAGLEIIHHLPADLRKTIDAKAVLAEIVLEGFEEREPVEQSMAIVRAMAGGITLEDSDARSDDAAPREAQFPLPALRALAQGLRQLDPARLEMRVRTGLDQPPQPAPLDLSAAQRVRSLLKEMTQDRELNAIARLAGNLMAAVAVPRTLRQQDDLPQGGFSDLTNRGPLDRLLISELAHDDQTLAVRLALNEALYLRRESPPRQPPQRRAILLDSGIRLWGVPRVFAAATALALIATAHNNCELFAFRARADGITPIDLTTLAGLQAHLEALEPAPHPGGSLAAFFAAIEDAANDTGEAMLITHQDVVDDPDFQLECAKHEKTEWFIAALSQSGALSLYRHGPGGRRLVSQAKLSLDEIQATAAPQRPTTPLIVGPDPRLPVILSARPFAFLLPQHVEPQLAGVSDQHGLVGLTKDGRLLHWPHDEKGGWQLSDTVPRGRCHGIHLHERLPQAMAVIQSARGSDVVMVIANLNTGKCENRLVQTLQNNPIAVAVWGDLLLLIYRTNIEAVSCQSGQFVARAPIPTGTIHQGGRFFFGQGTFFALTYDGQRLWLEKLAMPTANVIRFFDRRASDGPLCLLRDGRVAGPGGKWIWDGPQQRIKLLRGVSADGHRIVASSWHGSQPANFLLDLRAGGGWKRISDSPQEALLAPAIYRSTRNRLTLRHNFQGIYHRNGELALLSKKDRILSFSVTPSGEMVLLDRGPASTSAQRPLRFAPAAGPAGTRYELGVATWNDGSRAHLDSRGLLHLKSSDPTLPEISLVLSNGPLAGWSSDFERFGAPFFFDSAATSTAAHFHAAIRAFLARLR